MSTIKTSASDLLVQTVVEQKEDIDWKRNAAFATFGCFYLGGVQYAIYVPIFGRMFPNAASFAAKTLKQKLKDTKGQFTLGAQVRALIYRTLIRGKSTFGGYRVGNSFFCSC